MAATHHAQMQGRPLCARTLYSLSLEQHLCICLSLKASSESPTSDDFSLSLTQDAQPHHEDERDTRHAVVDTPTRQAADSRRAPVRAPPSLEHAAGYATPTFYSQLLLRESPRQAEARACGRVDCGVEREETSAERHTHLASQAMMPSLPIDGFGFLAGTKGDTWCDMYAAREVDVWSNLVYS